MIFMGRVHILDDDVKTVVQINQVSCITWYTQNASVALWGLRIIQVLEAFARPCFNHRLMVCVLPWRSWNESAGLEGLTQPGLYKQQLCGTAKA